MHRILYILLPLALLTNLYTKEMTLEEKRQLEIQRKKANDLLKQWEKKGGESELYNKAKKFGLLNESNPTPKKKKYTRKDADALLKQMEQDGAKYLKEKEKKRKKYF